MEAAEPWSREGRLTRALAVALVVMVTWWQTAQCSEAASKSASQCFRPGIAFVSLYCGLGKVVRVQTAFLGVHRAATSRACGHLDSDCHVDAGPQFDWARCQRRHSCVQIVQRTSRTPLCNGRPPTYLQVNYTCIKGEASSMTPMPPILSTGMDFHQLPTGGSSITEPTARTIQPGMGVKAANICFNKTVQMSTLYVQSPGFPSFYPPGLDCRCQVRAAEEHTITVRFDEVKLASPLDSPNQPPEAAPLCDDWLMLEAPQYQGAGVVVCQDVDPARRNLQSRSSHIILHLHTAPGDGITDRRGFKVMISDSGGDDLEIECYQTSVEAALGSIPPGVAPADPARPYALPPTNFGPVPAVRSSAPSAASRGPAHGAAFSVSLLVTLSAALIGRPASL